MTHRTLQILLITALVVIALPVTVAANCADDANDLTEQDVQAFADAYN